MRAVTSRAICCLTAASAWIGAGAVAAQSSQSPASGFGERVDVQLINVEAWVTDGDGEPVAGLGVEDFEVYEDGKIVEVSHFAEIRDPLLAGSFAPPEAVAAPLEAADSERPLELEELLRQDPREQSGIGFLVLYFDELFSGPNGRDQLVADLRTFIELRRVPHARVLILRQAENLRVEANLGSGRVELERALQRLAESSPLGVQTWAEEKNALRRIQDAWERVAVLGNTAPGQDPCDFFVGEATRQIQFHIERSRNRIRETLQHLTKTTSFLAGLPGPKTLIYVSDGLPTAPGTDLLSFVKALCPGQQGDPRLEYYEGLNDSFRRLSRHANANRVTIYTLQALGLRQRVGLATADQKGVRGTGRAVSRYDGESRILQRQGLTFLAQETGGRAVVNRNKFVEELEQIADDMSSFYSLAYVPPHGGDGLEHRIEVRVRDRPPHALAEDPRRQLRVRHRPGYRDKGRDQRMVERLESALYLNLMANPLQVKLGAGRVERSGAETSKVELHITIPVGLITFLPQRGGDYASVRVQVMARDERNRKTAFKQELFQLARPQQVGAQQNVSLVLHLDLETGIHIVAFGVHDEATQEASFVATGLEILG